jgi:hypothetical protein
MINGKGSTVDVVCILSTIPNSFLDNQISSLGSPLSAFFHKTFLKLAFPLFLFSVTKSAYRLCSVLADIPTTEPISS